MFKGFHYFARLMCDAHTQVVHSDAVSYKTYEGVPKSFRTGRVQML
jgi:hypothetical protein